MFAGLWLGVVCACVASFACVVAERVPAHRSINGRSECACGRQLKASENIPIVGWLRTGGTSSCCASKLPRSMLFAELAAFGIGGVAGVAVVAAGLLAAPVWAGVAAVGVCLLTGAGVTAAVWPRTQK